jgi:AcrR family transcriptional regulator
LPYDWRKLADPTFADVGAERDMLMTSRREELLLIAARVFAEQGYAVATIRGIAKAADLNSGTLYHHFESKEVLVQEILDRYWSEMFLELEPVANIPNQNLDTLADLIRGTIRVNEKMPFAAQIQANDWNYLVRTRPSIPKHVRRLEEIWVSALNRGKDNGAFRNDIDAKLMFRSIMASMSGLVFTTYRPGAEIQASLSADTQVALWTRALAPDPKEEKKKTARKGPA